MISCQFIKTLIIFSFGLGLSGCDIYPIATSESGRFYFTNDSSDSFTFLMDYQPIVIPQQGVGSILLKPGIHSMTTESGKFVRFIVYPGNKGGILNPSRQLYYAYNFTHGTEGIPAVYHLSKQSLVVNNYQLSGAINSSNDYVIDNNVFNCDFAVGTQVPEVLNSFTAVSQVKTKCFTHKELVDLIDNEDILVSQLIIQKMIINEPQSVTINFDYPLPTPEFSDEALQMYALDIVHLINNFRCSLDPDRKQYYYSQYHSKISSMAIIYSQMGTDRQSRQEKRKYINFMQQTRAIFDAGTLMYH